MTSTICFKLWTRIFLKNKAQFFLARFLNHFLHLKCGAVALKLSGSVPRWDLCDGAKILAEKTVCCSGAQIKKVVHVTVART